MISFRISKCSKKEFAGLFVKFDGIEALCSYLQSMISKQGVWGIFRRRFLNDKFEYENSNVTCTPVQSNVCNDTNQ